MIDEAIAEKMARLESEIADIKETLDFIKDTIVKADATITSVSEQVMPTVESLLKSPMIKMLGIVK